MISYDYITKEKKTQKKKMQLTMILITWRSRSRKTNTLCNLVKQKKDDVYKIVKKSYLYVKDSNEAK